MKNQRNKHYRHIIQQLSLENEELKAQLTKYNENGLSKLVDETLKMKETYTSCMKEAVRYRNEYRALVKEQKQLIKAYKEQMNHI